MRYNVGDKVVIVSKKGRENRRFGWNREGEMDKWLGKTMTIKSSIKDSYSMVEDAEERDGRGWCWDISMIDHKATAELNNAFAEKYDACFVGTSKFEIHSKICKELNNLYIKKNQDYGDSFSKVRNEIPNAIMVRLLDKIERLKTLLSGADQQVNDESIDDTLMDLANYCILELIERKTDGK